MTEPVKDSLGIFLITESKLHFSAPVRQLQIPNYCVSWMEQNKNDGDTALFKPDLIITNLSTSHMTTTDSETNIPNNKP